MSGSPTSCAANRRTVPAAGKVDGNKNQNFERKPIAVDHVIDDPHQGKVFAQVEYDATNGEFIAALMPVALGFSEVCRCPSCAGKQSSFSW